MGFDTCAAASSRKTGSGRTPPSDAVGDPVPMEAVFTIDDLVVYLKLPKRTVSKLSQESEIPGQKVRRHWRFHRKKMTPG